jgi:hypothetical protein
MGDAHKNQPVPSPQPSSATSGNVTGSQDGIIFVSLARTAAAYTSDEMFNPNCSGVRIYADVTVHNGGTLVLKVQTKDPLTGKFVDLTGSTTASWAGANQTRTLTIYPGITAAAGTATTNTEASAVLGTSWKLVATVTVATVTFSVGAEYLL